TAGPRRPIRRTGGRRWPIRNGPAFWPVRAGRKQEEGRSFLRPSSKVSVCAWLSSSRGFDVGVFEPEPFDAAGRVEDLLVACVERMAIRADFDVHLRGGRAGLEGGAARADDLDLVVLGVDGCLHVVLLPRLRRGG